MNNLVFLEPNKIDAIPFTTSDIIAENTNNKRLSVVKLIQKYEHDIEAFGRVRFKIEPFETKGGIQSKTVYELNEQQAYFVMTLMRNSDKVIEFKKDLVKAFFIMRTELETRQLAKIDRKPIRRELTDVIQSDPNASKWDYKLFTDLAYKSVLGRNAAQIRKERGAKLHDTASDYMTATEIAAITKAESQMSTLKELGMDYYQIKSLLLNRKMLGNVA